MYKTHPKPKPHFFRIIMSDSNDLERLERGPLPQFPEIPLSKPGPHFTSLLTTKPGEMADTNTHLEILQNELEEMLFNSTQRLYNLKEEEKVDDETIMIDRNVIQQTIDQLRFLSNLYQFLDAISQR